MIKHYNFVFEGKLIEVTAANHAEAQAIAKQIKYDMIKEQNETNEPVRS